MKLALIGAAANAAAAFAAPPLAQVFFGSLLVSLILSITPIRGRRNAGELAKCPRE
jgi:hypothetical protein